MSPLENRVVPQVASVMDLKNYFAVESLINDYHEHGRCSLPLLAVYSPVNTFFFMFQDI